MKDTTASLSQQLSPARTPSVGTWGPEAPVPRRSVALDEVPLHHRPLRLLRLLHTPAERAQLSGFATRGRSGGVQAEPRPCVAWVRSESLKLWVVKVPGRTSVEEETSVYLDAGF